MDEIRIFEEAHIPEVAALEMKVFHRNRQARTGSLEKYFEEIFFGNPWRDSELQSLVYMREGKIAGFAGVIPRRMQFRQTPVRVAVVSQLMVDPDRRGGMPGTEMIRRIFAGPQDLTITDGATEAACAVWTAAGARVAQLYSLQWMRILRPFAYSRELVASRPASGPGLRTLSSVAAPVCAAADAAVRKLPFSALRIPPGEFRREAVGAEALLAAIRTIGWREELQPCYDDDSFAWLLSQAALARRHGELRMCVARDSRGAPAGWFVYYVRRGGVCMTLQLGASRRHMEGVIGALLHDAWEQGGAAISGQVIPRALLEFSRRRCSFKYVGNGVLVHSRNRELLDCILRGDAAFSRLDGEWWARFSVGDWG